MNKVILIGNLTKDPELRKTSSDLPVCTLSIAVSRPFKSQNDGKDTDFFDVTVWRGQAENCAKYLKKGSKVGVVGKIQNRTYEANDGTKRYVTDIIADEVEFLTPKSQQQSDGYFPDAAHDLEPVSEEDLPF